MNKVTFLKPKDGVSLCISSTQRKCPFVRFNYDITGGYYDPAAIWESHTYVPST